MWNDTVQADNIYTIVNPVRQTAKAAGFTAYHKNFKFGYVPGSRNLLRLIVKGLLGDCEKINVIFMSLVFKQCHLYSGYSEKAASDEL